MPDLVSKRLLALDGGGILGVISLGVLAEIERQLRDAHGGSPSFRLRDYFDYIAGTSTGAIIAAGLAIGKSVEELQRFYLDHGAEMFDKASLLRRWRYSYEAQKLQDLLRKEFGDRSILEMQEAGELATDCHLLIVTRNVNTDSVWPVSTNPKAKYNALDHPYCNRLLPLWQLVRASTAAPTFFAPEELELGGGRRFLFEDGGVTAHNNPAFLLYRMATEPTYHCNWSIGEDQLMLVSVGTGRSFRTLDDPDRRGEGLLTTARTIPSELMSAIAVEQDVSCRTVGRCVHGSEIDREIRSLVAPHDPKRPKAFLYARYDIDVSQDGLAAAGLGDIDGRSLQMDNAAIVDDLVRIGKKAGEQVDMSSHFKAFMPGSPGAAT